MGNGFRNWDVVVMLLASLCVKAGLLSMSTAGGSNVSPPWDAGTGLVGHLAMGETRD